MQGRHPRTCPCRQRAPRDLEIAGRKDQLATAGRRRTIPGRRTRRDDLRPKPDCLLRGGVRLPAVAKKAPGGSVCDRTNSHAQFLKGDGWCRGGSYQVDAGRHSPGPRGKTDCNPSCTIKAIVALVEIYGLDKGAGETACFSAAASSGLVSSFLSSSNSARFFNKESTVQLEMR